MNSVLFYYTTVDDEGVYSCDTMPIVNNRLIQYAVTLPTEPIKVGEGSGSGGSGDSSGGSDK
jgi:hypothetical protein